MSNIIDYKRTKRINGRCSFLAMVLAQALLFTFEMSLVANIIAYVVNIFVWIIVGVVLEVVVATYHGVDLTKIKGK